jgi:GNAT superfamily N-acetyltransferase
MIRYLLRDARPDDFEFLHTLHVATLRPYVEETWGWDDADQLARFRARFDPHKVQVIVSDGQDVGALALKSLAEWLVIASLLITPAWQRRGLGSRIVEDLLIQARARRQRTRLQVLKVNPARRLYERLGFELVEETATHYVMETVSRR